MVEKKRKRVPVSCLNCKKRKVKCDKLKPSCSGCIKNGVEHLCQYLEPHWCKDEENDIPKDTVILNQKEQINFLKNQLALLQHKLSLAESSLGLKPAITANVSLSTPAIQAPIAPLAPIQASNQLNQLITKPIQPLQSAPFASPQTVSHPITILNKLRPLSVTSRDGLYIYCQSNYQIELVNNKKYFVDKYSWMSLIKLDPRLINLWLKMIRFHQYYIIYKRYQKNQLHALGKQAQLQHSEKCPVINPTADSTHGTSTMAEIPPLNPLKAGSGESQCPVIDTSQFIDSSPDAKYKLVSPTPGPPSSTPGSTISSDSPGVDTEAKTNSTNSLEETISMKISKAMTSLRNVWESMITLTDNEKINDKQLHFLMEFYFNNASSIKFDSGSILSFYRSEITGIIIKKGNNVMFDCTGFMKAEKNKSLLQDILVKGSYLCMLAIIVDETLCYLKRQVLTNPDSPISVQFKQMYPPLVVCPQYKRPVTNIYLVLEDFLSSLTWNSNNETVIFPFMPFIVVTIAWINQQMLYYNKRDFPSETKVRFTKIVTSFYQLLLNEDSMIEIWKDPYSIRFKDSSVKSDSDLAIHLSFVWIELIRLNNLLTFKCLPLIKNSELLDGLISRLYIKIEEADFSNCHVKYLQELDIKGSNFNDLIVNFKTHYLISRINSAINHGTMCLGSPKLTSGILQGLIHESVKQITVIETLQDTCKRFEASSILQYLSCYMAHIIMLQGEETKDEELIQLIVPDYFIRFSKFIACLKLEVIQKSHSEHCQYLLLIVTDFLTRCIQIVTGLIIRINSEDSSSPQELLVRNKIKQFEKFQQVPNAASITKLITQNMVKSIEDTLQLLRKSTYIDNERISKLANRWTDYLTITSKVNYSEVHKHLPELAGKFFPNGSTNGSSQATTQAINQKQESIYNGHFRRCPISHITTAMDDNPESPRIQGVLAHQSLDLTDDLERKRKCPFGHSLATSITQPEQVGTAVKGASNADPFGNSQRDASIVPKRENGAGQLAIFDPMRPDLVPIPSFDFNSLSELNFDFLQQDIPIADWDLTNDLLGDINFNI